MSLQERSLYVTGLPSGASAHDLEEIFKKAGTVESALLHDGGGFVCMTTKDGAMAAPMKIKQGDIKVQTLNEAQLTELQGLIDKEAPNGTVSEFERGSEEGVSEGGNGRHQTRRHG